MNPAQAAEMSNAGMFSAPIFCCTLTAVAGIGLSPVTVPTMIMSRSVGPRPAASSADRAAAAAMSLVFSPSPAMRRSRIPVRSAIQASEVSTIRSRSAFVRTLAGVYRPVPTMRLLGCRWVAMGDGLTRSLPREARAAQEPRRAPARSLGLGLGRLFDFDALVEPARCANPMGYGGFGTVGARDEVRYRHLVVVCTAHVALRAAFSSLGDCHGLLLPIAPLGQLEERQEARIGLPAREALIRGRTDTFTGLGAQGKGGGFEQNGLADEPV